MQHNPDNFLDPYDQISRVSLEVRGGSSSWTALNNQQQKILNLTDNGVFDLLGRGVPFYLNTDYGRFGDVRTGQRLSKWVSESFQKNLNLELYAVTNRFIFITANSRSDLGIQKDFVAMFVTLFFNSQLEVNANIHGISISPVTLVTNNYYGYGVVYHVTDRPLRDKIIEKYNRLYGI